MAWVGLGGAASIILVGGALILTCSRNGMCWNCVSWERTVFLSFFLRFCAFFIALSLKELTCNTR